MNDSHACGCIGPQNGEPKCPCMMRNVVQRDGHWIERERDLGPVRPSVPDLAKAFRTQITGCICPPGSEMTCQGPTCPRKALSAATS